VFIINELRVSQVVESDLLLVLEKFDDLIAAELLRVRSRSPEKPGAALVGLVLSLFDNYYENVPEALQFDLYWGVAVAGSILDLRLEPVGDLCPVDLSAISYANKYPAA
jgi:hypothetical protein